MKKKLTIEQAQTAKDILEKEIAGLLSDFYVKTNLDVSSIIYRKNFQYTGRNGTEDGFWQHCVDVTIVL